MEFNAKYHENTGKGKKYMRTISYRMGKEQVIKAKDGKDLIIIQYNMYRDKHVNKIFGKTYNQLPNV